MNTIGGLSGYGFFSNKKRAGIETSSIEHQDSVSAHIALLLQSETSPYPEIKSQNWSIMCEGEDDIEIISPELRVFIQVKKGVITKLELIEIINNFQNSKVRIIASGFDKTIKFQINALNGLAANLNTLPVKLNELRSRKKNYSQNEYLVSLNELSEQYEIDSKILVNLHIDTSNYMKDSDISKISFIHLLRKIYPVRIYSDEFAYDIYTSLSSVLFSSARRQRDSVTKSEVNELILSHIAPLNNISIEIDFVKTEKGYRKDPKLTKFLADEGLVFQKVIRKIKSDWIKFYWKTIIRNILLPSNEVCLECQHPLIAGFFGTFGLSCSSCGYTPFVSLVFACDCGDYSLIKSQPELGTEQCVEYISDYIRKGDTECDSCGDKIKPELLRRRWLVIPYPIPFSNFTPGKISEYFDKQ